MDETAALRTYLATRDIPCPGCGYNLRALATDRCPECNQPLELGVRLTDAAWGTLVGTIVTLSLLAGASGILLIFVLVLTVFLNDPPPGKTELFIFVVYPCIALLITSIAISSLMRTPGKRWFRQRTPAVRRGLFFAAIALVLAMLALWFIALAWWR